MFKNGFKEKFEACIRDEKVYLEELLKLLFGDKLFRLANEKEIFEGNEIIEICVPYNFFHFSQIEMNVKKIVWHERLKYFYVIPLQYDIDDIINGELYCYPIRNEDLKPIQKAFPICEREKRPIVFYIVPK